MRSARLIPVQKRMFIECFIIICGRTYFIIIESYIIISHYLNTKSVYKLFIYAQSTETQYISYEI